MREGRTPSRRVALAEGVGQWRGVGSCHSGGGATQPATRDPGVPPRPPARAAVAGAGASGGGGEGAAAELAGQPPASGAEAPRARGADGQPASAPLPGCAARGRCGDGALAGSLGGLLPAAEGPPIGGEAADIGSAQRAAAQVHGSAVCVAGPSGMGGEVLALNGTSPLRAGQAGPVQGSGVTAAGGSVLFGSPVQVDDRELPTIGTPS
jgi:hypothetical protein